MRKKIVSTSILVFWIVFFAIGQKQDKTVTHLFDESAQPPEMVVDNIHLKAEILKIIPLQKYVETRSSYTFRVLRTQVDSLVYYAPEAKITNILIENVAVPFKQEGDKIIVYPTTKLQFNTLYTIVLDLTTTCNTGMPSFTGWDDQTNTKRKQIWGFALSKLFPDMGIKHDLLTTELIVDFDSKYKVFSNGDRLLERANSNGTTTWHYKMNRNHYFGLLVLVIGEYAYTTFSTERGVPLEYWYYPDRKNAVEPTYRYSKEMFAFFEKEMGLNYPWELYRQVPIIDCPFGAMETTTATIYNDGMLCDSNSFIDRNYINVNAHELTHQWFGNYNSYSNGQNVWTSESFATYFGKKFQQSISGDDLYQKMRNDELKSTLLASKTDDYPVGSQRGGTARWYPKGSLVIDMLRYVMGDTAFKTFIAYYLKKHAYAVVDWNDLKVSIRESTGLAMDWFFDQWINRGGEPKYKVFYKEMNEISGQRVTQISVQQTHETNALIGYFKMPIVFEVHYTDGSFNSQISWIEKEFTNVSIANLSKKEIAFVLFDPNRNVIKQVDFKRPFESLSAQLLHASNMIDRYDALLELKQTAVTQKRALLLASYAKESFSLLKSEIIAQLADDTDLGTLSLFTEAGNDPDVAVRLALSTNVKKIPVSTRAVLEKLLNDSSYMVIINALDNLAYNFPTNIEKYLFATSKIDGNMFHTVHLKWLEQSYEKSKQLAFAKELTAYSNISRYDNNTIIPAIAALRRMNYLDAKLAGHLFAAATYWSGPVNEPAKAALRFYYEQNSYKKLLKNVWNELDSTTKEKTKALFD